MAANLNQVTATASPALLGNVVPGGSFTATGATTAYIGMGSGVSSSNGFQLGASPMFLNNPKTAAPVPIWVVGSGVAYYSFTSTS